MRVSSRAPRLRAARLAVAGLLLALLAAPAEAGRKRPALQTEPWGHGDDAAAERFLLDAEIVETREIGSGVTLPRKVTLSLGGETRHAVWKNVEKEYTRPDTGSPRMDDMYFTDRWQNEVAAYRVDRLVGLHRVPVTVIRSIDGRPGSLQAWVDSTVSERERVEENIALRDPARYARESDLLRVFDALIYNVDRTQENILIQVPESRIWLIDQSRAFRLRGRLPADARKGVPVVPPEIRSKLASLSREDLDAALGTLLTRGQIKAILKRRDRLLAWIADQP